MLGAGDVGATACLRSAKGDESSGRRPRGAHHRRRNGNPTPMVDWGDDGTIPLSFQTAYARCVSFAHGLFARLDANGSVDEGTRGIVIQLTCGGDGHRRGQDGYRGIAMLRSEIDGLY